MKTVILTVTPSINNNGERACGRRGPLFDVAARQLVTRSTTPLPDAARVLLAEGVDPATPLVMRHAGADHDALRTTVGAAARLTVADNGGKPVFRRWQPRPEDAPRRPGP